jgi:hypothetical protein
MSDEPKVTLKASIGVQGKQRVKELAAMIVYKKKSGHLAVDVSEGGAVAASFEEKIVLDKSKD